MIDDKNKRRKSRYDEKLAEKVNKEVKEEIRKAKLEEKSKEKERLGPELLRFEADHIWVHKNIEFLLRQYAEQWIGVRNGRVIANGSDLTILLSMLPDPSRTCVEFITREPMEMLL